jgi:hypothetical protein
MNVFQYSDSRMNFGRAYRCVVPSPNGINYPLINPAVRLPSEARKH